MRVPTATVAGWPLGRVGSFQDRTPHRRAEEALPLSERKARAIFDQTLQFTGLLTPEGIVCHDLFLRRSLKHERGLRLAAADFPNYFKAIGNRASVLADDAHTTAGSRSGLPMPGARCLQGLLTPSIAIAPRAARVPVAKQPCIR